MRTSYLGFHVDDPSALPEKTHREIARAFERMASDGIFHRDVLAAGKSVSPTFVSRTLLGERGMTYHYQRLRIFAHPWDEETQPDASHPFRAVKRLNDALVSRSTAVLRASSDPRLGDGVDGSCDFNVTLINLMEPASRCAEVPLKDEALFGMGKARSVRSPHADWFPYDRVRAVHAVP
jgi:alpha-ketoglutarate-dependent dioxygenase FTO